MSLEVSRWAGQDVQGSTRFVRIDPMRRRLDVKPVIYCHGWPQSSTPSQYLADQLTANIDALLSGGRTVYIPFTGANWGSNSTYPSVGGTGLQAITDVVTAAAADGFDTTTVHLMGASMGACNVMGWGWRNPTKVAGVYLLLPCLDLLASYDALAASANPAIIALNADEAMLSCYSAADRAALVTASASFDPARNTGSVNFGARVAGHAHSTDEVVPIAAVQAVFAAIGATQLDVEAGGSHFFESDFDSADVAAWFAALS